MIESGKKQTNAISTWPRAAGRKIALAILVLALIWLVCAYLFSWLARVEDHPPGQACGVDLSGLAKAMVIYAHYHDDKYPTPNKWCDLLLQCDYASERRFVCRSAGQGRSHYAMNPNCEPNSPPDTVLLFETEAGWNQFGGPELLTFDNHYGEGCNVAFNDTHVEFISPKETAQLKWSSQDDQK